MMSATPIPRTLAMSYYADLDVSVIDELPPGRTPVLTKLVPKRAATKSSPACVTPVAPAAGLLGLPADRGVGSCNCRPRRHARAPAPNCRRCVGLVHGRLKGDEKAAVMAAFAAGRDRLLVATTVIEVGVDVPNASLMVIEHAERFGLSQLHQLRGRVGRGADESACILLYAPRSARRRARG
jgi:ATP-dependent DNA helicase RecG